MVELGREKKNLYSSVKFHFDSKTHRKKERRESEIHTHSVLFPFTMNVAYGGEKKESPNYEGKYTSTEKPWGEKRCKMIAERTKEVNGRLKSELI